MHENIGSQFDDFLKEENIFDEVEAIAAKRIIAHQIQQELQKKHLSKVIVAQKMRTSRASLDRLLDPTNTGITLKTLVKIAHILGKKVNVSFAS